MTGSVIASFSEVIQPRAPMRVKDQTKTALAMKKFLLLCFSAMIAGHALAWGTIGHRTIAYIAQDALTPRAKTRIFELLSLEKARNLADISMWADQHRKEHPELPSHGVGIPVNQEKYSERRDCSPAKQLCVVKGLQQQIALLRDEKLPPPERLQALKMVIHFVGDIHQPLHAIQKTGAPAILNDEELTMHEIWDTQSVEQFGLSARPLSRQLESGSPVDTKGAPEDWANEGHALALRYFKPFLEQSAKGDPIMLPDDYLKTIAPVVRIRLRQAGMRLGNLLNSIFDH